MGDTKLLDILQRIFDGETSARQELSRTWSEPLDRRLAKLSRDNQRRVEILLEAIFDECKDRFPTPERLLKHLNEVTSLVDGMERILGS